MKQQLFKLSIILFIGLNFFSCVADEEEISTQDLLFGKWKTTSYTENEVTPVSFTNCDYESTMEFSENEITYVNYVFDDETSNCIFNETYVVNYQLVNDRLFKIMQPNGIIVENDILALSSTELKIKSVMNGTVTETSFERIY